MKTKGKIFAVILSALLILLPTTALARTAPAGGWGDTNLDGEVDPADALNVLWYSMLLYQPFPGQEGTYALFDLDASGRIDSGDALLILQYSVDLIDDFPAAKI